MCVCKSNLDGINIFKGKEKKQYDSSIMYISMLFILERIIWEEVRLNIKRREGNMCTLSYHIINHQKWYTYNIRKRRRKIVAINMTKMESI